MKKFTELAQPENALVLDEMKNQFLTEFDFTREGAALKKCRENLKSHFKNIVIPEPIFYNEDIVIMEYLKGYKVLR